MSASISERPPSYPYPELPNQHAWRDNRNCADADPDIFFIGQGESSAPAKAICAQCVVVEQCRDFAIEIGELHGIFGGMTYRQRLNYKKAHPNGASEL